MNFRLKYHKTQRKLESQGMCLNNLRTQKEERLLSDWRQRKEKHVYFSVANILQNESRRISDM